jgi:transglutaminase-like putative cysteine protease
MSRLLARAALSAALLAAAGAAGIVTATTTDPDKPSARAGSTRFEGFRTFTFAYEVVYGQIPRNRGSFDFWIPLPANDANQKIRDLVIQSPFAGKMSQEPVHGNGIYWVSTGPRGGVPLNLIMRFTADRGAVSFPDLSGKPAVPKDSPKNLDLYLKPDPLAPLDAETKALAAQVTRGKTAPAEKARAIYDHVVANIRYDKSGEGWGTGDPKRTLASKRGNSLDLVSIFLALARASGIPCRIVSGFKIPTSGKEGFITEYHSWLEFHLPGFGWVPADPAEGARNPSQRSAYFGGIDADRIQFSVGREITLEPRQNGDPIGFWLYPYAEADGLPLGGASYRFKWSEPPPPKPAG